MPYLTMVWVWPPQTSISTQRRVVIRRISATIFFASASSRYSSRYFMGWNSGCRIRLRAGWCGFFDIGIVELGKLLHIRERLIGPRRDIFIDPAERKPNVDQHVIADLH